jgi:hypothetical protein
LFACFRGHDGLYRGKHRQVRRDDGSRPERREQRIGMANTEMSNGKIKDAGMHDMKQKMSMT